MPGRAPSLEELRRHAEREGVAPSDADLERVRGFLEVVLPAFESLEQLVSAESPPAAVFRPEVEP